MFKKIQVSFSDDQMKLLDYLKGEMGETDAKVVRSIVIVWFSERKFIDTVVKQRLLSNQKFQVK